MMENAKSYPYPEVSKRFEDYMIFDVIDEDYFDDDDYGVDDYGDEFDDDYNDDYNGYEFND